METCLQIHNGVEALRPASTEFSYAQRSLWAWEVCRQIYKDVGVYKTADYRLTTALKHIDLSTMSTQIKIENVQKFWVTSTKTTASSNVTSTQSWEEYKITAIKDPVNVNTVQFGSYFPDERIVRVKYLAYPALFPTTSTDSTSIPDIDDEATNVIKYGLMVKILKAGDAPDVQLANQYTMDFNEEMRRCKTLIRNKNRKTASPRVSYREWEW